MIFLSGYLIVGKVLSSEQFLSFGYTSTNQQTVILMCRVILEV